jgi:hypothetical protein
MGTGVPPASGATWANRAERDRQQHGGPVRDMAHARAKALSSFLGPSVGLPTSHRPGPLRCHVSESSVEDALLVTCAGVHLSARVRSRVRERDHPLDALGVPQSVHETLDRQRSRPRNPRSSPTLKPLLKFTQTWTSGYPQFPPSPFGEHGRHVAPPNAASQCESSR